MIILTLSGLIIGYLFLFWFLPFIILGEFRHGGDAWYGVLFVHVFVGLLSWVAYGVAHLPSLFR